jgi:outer membrane lipoprotein-sorting protein
LQRHRSLRWLAPLTALGIVGLVAAGMLRAAATPDPLPTTTAAALIADIQTTGTAGFSGTVVTQLSLGLPALPAFGKAGNGASLTSLLSGSHTLQVWYGGPAKQRVALLGTTDETDVFRNGRDMWQWSSASHVAAYTLLPEDGSITRPLVAPASAASLTPLALAHRALAALDPSTKVTVTDGVSVADRAGYLLTLTPRSSKTRIGSVRITVDGATKVPLGVQVYARQASTPAIDVAFTTIRYRTPADTYFRFTPPVDARVHRLDEPSMSSSSAGRTVRVIGAGWSSVVGVGGFGAAVTQFDKIGGGSLAGVFTAVSGSWGRGRLLESALFSALLTDDGHVYVGAVDPPALYAAAGRT